MTPTEAAWLAGFIDGEGTIYNVRSADPRYPERSRHSQRITLGNTSGAALLRCHDITGVGKIRFVKAGPLTKKPFWKWSISAWNDVRSILQQLLPYLVVKRELAERCIADAD